jgi:hypothetical protein
MCHFVHKKMTQPMHWLFFLAEPMHWVSSGRRRNMLQAEPGAKAFLGPARLVYFWSVAGPVPDWLFSVLFGVFFSL